MNREQAIQLTKEASAYLGREIQVNILDENNKPKQSTKCKFTNWTSISISEVHEEPNIQLFARCEDINEAGKIYMPSLKSAIDEFKRMDKDLNPL